MAPNPATVNTSRPGFPSPSPVSVTAPSSPLPVYVLVLSSCSNSSVPSSLPVPSFPVTIVAIPSPCSRPAPGSPLGQVLELLRVKSAIY
ncbi:unnamed protein product [Linum trigynum]|uniref:Uncharacterized protein n=1 Tax=Linum trigynum TaxID=586398 RepID=A0AAV2GMT3_9ROSI